MLTTTRLARMAGAVALGLVLALVVDVARTGGIAPWLARRGLAPPYVPQGQRVMVGDRRMYLDCRGEGSPTVVLEAGMGGAAASWSPVFDGIAGATRTCAYDRAGLGSSDARGLHTIGDAVVDLRAALEAAGEAPPFIHVGHSLGGAYSRIFADAFRRDTAGIVLIDTFDPDLETAVVHPLLGSLRAEYEERLDGLRATVAAVESLDWPASEHQLRQTDVAGLPITVLRAPRAEPRLDGATNDRIAAAVRAAYEALSPGMVRYEIADGAGHLVHVDRPDLVIAAVTRLVEAAREGRAALALPS